LTSGYGRYWKRIIGCEENDKEWRLVLQTVRFIERATNGSDTRPFFIAIGHHRPHIPWESPTRFIDQYYVLHPAVPAPRWQCTRRSKSSNEYCDTVWKYKCSAHS
jgi:hypothetical protein